MKQLQRDNKLQLVADPKSPWVEIIPEEYLDDISPTGLVALRVLSWHIQLLRGQPQDPTPEGP